MAKKSNPNPAPKVSKQSPSDISKREVSAAPVFQSDMAGWVSKDMIWVAMVALFGFLLYANTLSFNYTFDDDIYTLKNKYAMKGMSELGSIWKYGTIKGFTVAPNNSGIYRPVSLTSFAMERSLFGELSPHRSHAINVFLYAAMLAALTAFLLRIFRNIQFPIYIPILIAVLYATHPLHTEVVASVKSRDEILAMLFPALALLSLWQYLHTRKILYSILAGVLFFFGVAAKENPLTLIAVIPIIVHLFAKKDWGTSLKVSAPFFVAAFFYLALRTNILDKDNSSGVNMIVNNIVWGAKGPQILSTNLSVWLEYLRLLIFPHPLSYDYSFNQIPLAGWDSPRVWLSLLAYIGIFVGGGYLVYKKNLVGLGLLFYGFTFAIFSNIIPKFVLASTLAERFMFMPSLGYCMAVVLGLYYLVQKISAAQTANIVIALCAIVGLGYSYLTIQRNPVWESNATLFGSGISTSPESFRTHYNIGEILRVEGELKKQAAVAKKDNAAIQQANAMLKQAGVHYKNSLNIYPKNDNNWYNLGICYINNNDTLEAEKAFQKSLDVNPKNGLSANNLGVIYFWKKNYPKAIEIFELAVKGQNPQIGNAYSNLGAAYHNMGNSAKAIENYEKALTYSQGKNIPLYQNLANIYNSLGNKEKAEQYMRMMK